LKRWLLKRIIRGIVGGALYDDIEAIIKGILKLEISGEDKKAFVIKEIDKKGLLVNLAIEVIVYLSRK